MTIEEAIKRAEETAIGEDELCKRYDRASGYSRSHDETIRTTDAKRCEKIAQEHRQLAEWLKDYKRLLENSSEIPTGSDDCISRQAVEDAMYDATRAMDLNYGQIMDYIDNLPSVTPIRPKGHWIEHPHEWGDNWQYSQYECSCCHNWAHFDTDYCPNCGTEMEEVKV
jgi:hypothetical protein